MRNSSRRDGAARLVHDGARHLRSLPRAALQSLSVGRARRRRGARLSARARRSRSWRSSRRETLPQGFGYEWTTLAFQQIARRQHRDLRLRAGVVFVFLVLAAQYESLTLPLAVILIVPMCLIASIVGVVLRGQDNNILTQVGFIVLIGLAAKNAILIVEFAKQLEDQGRNRFDAAVEAARLRLRPILMTSLAFIFGVSPLVWAIGAGAELRQTLGTAVFSGMIGVTVFGLIFTPVFYVVTRWIAVRLASRRGQQAAGRTTHESVTAANDDEIRFRSGAHPQGRRPAAARRRPLRRRRRAGRRAACGRAALAACACPLHHRRSRPRARRCTACGWC